MNIMENQDRIKELEETIKRLCRHFPTDGDLQEAGWESKDIEDACNAYDHAKAVLARSNI